jgi:hypothetical protein
VRGLFILNSVLVVAIAFLAVATVREWDAYEETHSPRFVQADTGPSEAVPQTGDLMPDDDDTDWSVAASRNPFSFDRSDVPIRPRDAEAEAAERRSAEQEEQAAEPRPGPTRRCLGLVVRLGHDPVRNSEQRRQ